MFRRLMLGGVVALFGHCVAAQATIMDVTYTGTIFNDFSTDGGGMFGTAGASLAGKNISVSYFYDTALAPIVNNPTRFSIKPFRVLRPPFKSRSMGSLKP